MVSDVVNALPAQYWLMPTTAWHIHPTMINALRQLKDTAGLPLFLEVGDYDGAAVGRMFGFPVIPNSYLAAPAIGSVSMILACWDSFLTIADAETITIKRFEQTQAGFVTLYAEQRMASSIRNPFAGVFLKGV